MAKTNVFRLNTQHFRDRFVSPRRMFNADSAFFQMLSIVAASVVCLLLAILVYLTISGRVSIETFGWRFLTSTTWDPARGRFGVLPFMYGTIVSSLLALALALPVSLGVAIYLSEWAPEFLREPLGFTVELLAAVPSVVYGLWGSFVLVPFLRDHLEPWLGSWFGILPLFRGAQYGYGMLAAGAILAIMITPTIASVGHEVMRAVPRVQREGALALGATQWEAVRLAVLPQARSGLVGAAILGLGRALGETMAVTMVIGCRADISASLFAPAYTMASVIANEFTEATGELHLAALAEIGLLLFLVTLVLNAIARLLIWRVAKVTN